jgi:hypothetical protein
MIALGLSLLASTVLMAIVGFSALESTLLRKQLAEAFPKPPTPDSIATIFAEIAENRPTLERANPPQKSFARTSPDQAAPPDDNNTAFIGERDTKATSDRTPDATAPPLPSQAGIDPNDREIETTKSSYRDGKLSANTNPEPMVAPAPATPASDTPTPPEPSTTAETKPPTNPDIPGNDSERSTPPVREKLLDGPNPVDVQVPREAAKQENIKPTPEKRPREVPPAPPESVKPAEEPKIAELPKPPPPPDPAFSGFQRKTAIVGSISRTGRSALDVVDTPLGRYEAAISRAVELEFQRNCVRHRDFITPGFLTVRFFVEPGGKVRSVSFDGDMVTGEIQKGFTLNSVRNAEIPPMPPSLRKEYAKEPLELIYRFHF